MEFLLFLMLIGVVIALAKLSSFTHRVEHRLMLVENELRRRIALSLEILPESVAAPAPLSSLKENRPAVAPSMAKAQAVEEPRAVVQEPEPAPEPEPEAKPEPEPEIAPQPVYAEPAQPNLATNFEELFGRKLPIWAGGITLAVAGVLIVKYAIDIGLFGRVFTPPVQVICGALFGFGLVGGAEWAHRQRDRVDDPRVAQALAGAGISTLYAALLVAANAYDLISPVAAFIGMALVTAMALGLSLRHGMPAALLGLAGGLAAPALTVGITANVPLLAVYLGFTIAGLVGVSRAQRWPWLAAIALLGGAGWSLWLILFGQALDALGALSVGGFVLLLAVAAPLFAFEGARSVLARSVAAVVGALQLAVLVAMGGFAPLDWGLFVLIAAAVQWLAWREQAFAILPTISAALSALLLMIWPSPEPLWLATIALALAAIHAGPLLARLWHRPANPMRAVELSAIALFAPILVLRHSPDIDAAVNLPVALTALLAAGVPMLAAALGWKAGDRREDFRFAALTGTTGLLVLVAGLFALPHWQAPLVAAAVAALLTLLSRRADDLRLEGVASGFVVTGVLLLGASETAYGEWRHLAGLGQDLQTPFALLRWGALAAAAGILATVARHPATRLFGQATGAALAYGALAQALPAFALPLVAPAGALALALAGRRLEGPRTSSALLTFVTIAGLWAFLPAVTWLDGALRSLVGIPMLFDRPELALAEVARRLFAPALMFGTGLWLLRDRLSAKAGLPLTILAAVPGVIALHCFYRAGFVAASGSDFVATGLAQRMVWSGLLAAAGFALWKRTSGVLAQYLAPTLVAAAGLHTLWFSLLLHNPLWSAQAVGLLPLVNLLPPLFALVPLCLALLGRMAPDTAPITNKALQPAIMLAVALFAWASLRQLFHGSLLAVPGLDPSEDISRSILGIALAVGYLLWGIRRQDRDWRIASLVLMLAAVAKVFLLDASGLDGLLRIASFVALGFSLIGIGWLYSRQLRRDGHEEGVAA